ncbi:MAG: hypothetical protein OXC31_08475 [Spirochaetaceae bacterium]|nr:hypothetical protein [Spirochaetaceae bacterium]
MDFIAYGGDGLIAIEVKRTRTIRRADLHALKQFRIDYPMARCVLLFGGDRREYREGIELLPLADSNADPGVVRQETPNGRHHMVAPSIDWREFELAAPLSGGLVCFRRRAGDAFNESLMNRLNESGALYLTHAMLDDRFVLRLAVGSSATRGSTSGCTVTAPRGARAIGPIRCCTWWCTTATRGGTRR